ncbi:MAG: toll/interleukin-1 receptor domain-containing protein [Hyphomonadaceae bacterium]|nr:toll/interleukin-1 receptor domain-containing protein [Hyphomonadaceae bacterium]
MAKIFISYRRSDSQYQADKLYNALKPHVDDAETNIFIDVDNIPFGVDFVEYLDGKVGQCEVLLAVIGDRWLSEELAPGHRRIDDPGDFVRIEIASALKRGISVVPVLLDGVQVPSAEELPDDLKPLSRRNGVPIQRLSFDADVARLVRGLPIELKPSASVPSTPEGPAPSRASNDGGAKMWLSIESSLDPRDYQEFKEHFPTSKYAFEAGKRLRQLKDWSSIDQRSYEAVFHFRRLAKERSPLFAALEKSTEKTLGEAMAAVGTVEKEYIEQKLEKHQRAGTVLNDRNTHPALQSGYQSDPVVGGLGEARQAGQRNDGPRIENESELSGSGKLLKVAVGFLLFLIVLIALLQFLFSREAAIASTKSEFDPGSIIFATEPTYEDPVVLEAIMLCDQLAGHYADTTIPPGTFADGQSALTIGLIRKNPEPATKACSNAVLLAPGSPRMKYNLGRAYNAQRNKVRAIENFEAAALLGQSRAIVQLATEYTNGGAYVQDFARAEALLELAASRGDVIAKSALGSFYFSGVNGEPQPERALAYFEDAITFPRAMYNIGVMKRHGIGTNEDSDEAIQRFKSAAKFTATAPLSATQLGWMYETGLVDGSPDFQVAEEYYTKAYENGHVLSALALAKLYLATDHFPNDRAAGVTLLRQALYSGETTISHDVFWTYIPNPDFQDLAEDAVVKLNHELKSENVYSQLLEDLNSSYRSRKFPLHEDIICAPGYQDVDWCLDYWDSLPARELPNFN